MTPPKKHEQNTLMPCPFCGVHLIAREGSHKHPTTDCFMCGMVIFYYQYDEWNTRADLATPCAEVVEFIKNASKRSNYQWSYCGECLTIDHYNEGKIALAKKLLELLEQKGTKK